MPSAHRSRPLASVAAATGIVGAAGIGVAAGCVAYAAGVEVRSFRLRRVDVPILPPAARPIRVLHISDLHLVPRQRAKQEWLSRLAGLEPDLVIDTGDNISHRESIPFLTRSLGRLLDKPGVFVWGSNDYYAPVFKNPASYLIRRERTGSPAPVELPWRELGQELRRAGWEDLTDRRVLIDLNGTTVEFRGTDDAHLQRDDYRRVAGPTASEADVSVGVTHAPYLRVIDAMAADDLDLIVAGHTHGGQICVPGYGALVTNCDLDTRRVKGLSEHRVGAHRSALHVSGGLGTSPFAPIRFACPPEATLMTWTPRTSAH